MLARLLPLLKDVAGDWLASLQGAVILESVPPETPSSAGSGFHPEPGEVYYQRAPIAEAVIEIRVLPREDSALDQIERLTQQLAEGYPTRRDRFEFRSQIELGEHLSTEAKQRKVGFDFVSNDGYQILQARVDGFAFSRLRPYQTWRMFRLEAERLWHAYVEVLAPERLTRLGVRFINRLELPMPFADFSQYLHLAPEIPSQLPQAVTQFLIRLEVPDEVHDALIVINETILPQDEPTILPILLDIDVFRNLDVPPTGFNVWEALDGLRNRKNEVFEASITDRLRELIR